MKRVLVFQHVAHEILGTFHPLLREAGIRIRYVNFSREPDIKVDVSDYEGLIVLGGPMGVWEMDKHPHLKHEIECIQTAMNENKPVLGICLGGQLIASALGAEVKPAKEKEIGWFDLKITDEGKKDPLLAKLETHERIFQWHQDAFDLPKGALWLATSERCKYQAFKYGEKTYSFQFHLEVDQPMIERWLALPANQPDLAQGLTDKIRNDTFLYIDKTVEMSRSVFSHYLELFSTKKRKISLGSE